ncbi:histidine phosphatase family protein [Candidatus Woesearchaeota archaeon]|nr:histidine phosphatase family protein [Candidatus Woesearchaeota archaeon]
MGNERGIIDSVSPKFDLGLSEKGKEQARELISKLSKYNFDIFIVSPLKRTAETIKPFLKTLHNPRVIVSELTLERNAGKFIGKPLPAIKDYCEQNNINRVTFIPKSGESILELYEKAKKFLKFLKQKYSNESILICGHKNFIICLKIVIENKDIQDYYSFEPIKNNEIWEFNIQTLTLNLLT